MITEVTGSRVRIFTVPTDLPEGDGSFKWDSTTMLLVEVQSEGKTGIGYSYVSAAAGAVAKTLMEKCVHGKDVFAHGEIWLDMVRQVRNDGVTGLTQMAISAIDNALWDLRAKLLNVTVAHLLGMVRTGIAVYGSGGFTTYDNAQLIRQMSGWAEKGFLMTKMKIGAHPEDDPRRVAVARKAIGERVQLFVDANGALDVAHAIDLAYRFAANDVRWFEEPVSSDNLEGLREVKERAPAGMDIAAGEYGFNAWYFRRMIAARSVTVLQADATRCGGITGFLQAAALCWADQLPLSSHCGPSMHLHVCCAAPRAVHMEFFHDHARIERLFFDGFSEPKNGIMSPDLTRPGFGLDLKEADMARYQVG